MQASRPSHAHALSSATLSSTPPKTERKERQTAQQSMQDNAGCRCSESAKMRMHWCTICCTPATRRFDAPHVATRWRLQQVSAQTECSVQKSCVRCGRPPQWPILVQHALAGHVCCLEHHPQRSGPHRGALQAPGAVTALQLCRGPTQGPRLRILCTR